jgi:Ser/Thr protein kinase RdoA (MazF antagonist)
MADKPPRQARLFSFATGQPLDEDPEIIETLNVLSRIAGRAMNRR